jgi:DNA-binding transcriptional MerR regulator
VSDRSYLSIGEVLGLLKPEFSDLTISKIRFLESQGLLDPERTPSGYRKFYEPDVERLRWILRQQQDNYLPLKVIKGKLGEEGDDEWEPGDEPAPDPRADNGSETLAGSGPGATRAGVTGAVDAGPAGAVAAAMIPPDIGAGGVARLGSTGAAAGERTRGGGRSGGGSRGSRSGAADRTVSDDEDATGISLTMEELSAAAGLSAKEMGELERFGLILGKSVAGTVYYDGEALAVAHLAAGFTRFGVEARHLRMYKTAAEREAAFFEQVVTPMLKQRNPQARRQAVETLRELSKLGQGLRAAMVRQALRDYTS